MQAVLRRAVVPLLPSPWREQVKHLYRRVTLGRGRRRLIQKPTNPAFIDVLLDPAFRASVDEVQHLTPADTAILAQLWQLCRISDRDGIIVEVGAYKGGTALHLSNARPETEIIVCDTFEGFRSLPMEPLLDRREADWRARHGSGPFEDTSAAAVHERFRAKGRRVTIIKGRFPQSDTEERVRNIGFAHVDVTLFESCRATLDYLAPRSRPGAIWVIDSYKRQTDGVDHAVEAFVAENSDWLLFPVYPGQAVLFNRHRAEPPGRQASAGAARSASAASGSGSARRIQPPPSTRSPL
jgi:hypothetical protein